MEENRDFNQNSNPQNYDNGSNFNNGSNYDNGSYGYDPYNSYQQPPRNQADGYAIGSLICGIIGLFVLGIILGIVAIVLGNKSIRTNGPSTMAKAGKILGIICIVVFVIEVIVLIVAGLSFGLAMAGF